MKKISKILCAVLVLAVLCSSFAFIASADEFTPTATYGEHSFASAKLQVEGNNFQASFNNAGSDYILNTVKRADGTDYYQATTAYDGIPASHTQWILHDSTDTGIQYAEGVDHYFVYDLDFATESELTWFSIVPDTRVGSGGSGLSGGTGSTSILTKNFSVNPGEFHHLTLVGCLETNKVYVYMDNGLIYSGNLAAADVISNWKAGSYEAGILVRFKIQAHVDYKVNGAPATPLVKDQTFLMDNGQLNIYDSATAGNLAAVLGSNLSGWDMNKFDADYVSPVVPDLAEIDGVRYNNTHDINNALGFSLEPKQVTILRETKAPFTVACDAVITANGITSYTLAEGCTSVDNGDGTITVDAPFVPNMTTGTLADANAVLAATKYNAPDNKLNSVSLSTNSTWNTEGARHAGFVTDNSTGATFYEESLYGSTLSASNEYINFYFTPPTYEAGKTTYTVIDFDVATDGVDAAARKDIPIYHTIRGLTGTFWGNKVGTAHQLAVFNGKINEFAHVTMVFDFTNNVRYVFVDGALIESTPYGAYGESNNGDFSSKTISYFELRFGSNNIGKYALDNLYARNIAYTTGDDALATSLAASDILSWSGNIYNDDYVMPSYPALATVDGVPYTSLEDVEMLLQANNSNPTVVILHQPERAINVGCNAVIKTNGLENAINVTAGTAAWNDDNTVCTVTGVPYVSNIQKTDLGITAAESSNVLDTAVSSNIVRSFTVGNFSAGGQGSWFTLFEAHGLGSTDLYGGAYVNRDYVSSVYSSSDTSTHNNPFFNAYTGDNLVPKATGYYVVDIDLGTHSEFISDIDISSAVRTETGSSIFATNAIINNFLSASDEWQHVTLVGDLAANKLYAFVDGKLASIVGSAYGKSPDTEDEVICQGFRLELGRNAWNASGVQTRNKGEDVLYDNVAYRVFKTADDANGLSAAVASGDLTGWTLNALGRSGEKLPAIIEVNGEGHANAATASAALTTNDVITAKLVSAPTLPIEVYCNGTIDTNGFGTEWIVAAPGASLTVDGDIVTVTAPYMENKENLGSITTGADIKSNALISGGINLNLSGPHSTNGVGNSGAHQFEVISNTVQGNTIVHQSVNGGTLGGKNEYFGFEVNPREGYTKLEGQNQYGIVELDFAVDPSNTGSHYALRHIMRPLPAWQASGDTGYWGSEANLVSLVPADGKMYHITIVYDFDNNKTYCYRDGTLYAALPTGPMDANGFAVYEAGSTVYTSELRMGANSSANVYFDNVIYKHITGAADVNAIGTVIANSGKITEWSGSLQAQGYVTSQLPKLATVDGVDYYSAAALSDALYGNVDTPKQVEFFHSTDAAILVSCDAVINTNTRELPGLSFARGTKVENGKYITFDCNFISDTKLEQVTDYVAWTDEIKVNEAGNLIDRLWYNDVNCFMNTSWIDADGKTVNGLNTYHVSTAGDSNKYGLIARAPLAEDEGLYMEKGTYFNWNFNVADTFNYSAEENNYWVYDFDAYIEGDALKMFAVNLIKDDDGNFHYGYGEAANDIAGLINANGYNGQFVHVTIVSDLNNNKLHVFFNNEQVSVGAVAANHEAIVSAASDAVFQNHGFRMSFSMADIDENQTFAIDNAYAQHIKTSTSANLADVLASETPDLSNWTLARYNGSYKLPAAPAIGTVDGVPYYGTESISAAIAQPGNHEVVITRDYRGTITVDGNAVIDTQKLALADVELAVSGTHEFMLNGENAVASSKYAYSFDGSVHTVEVITAENYADHTTEVYWFTEYYNDIYDVYNVVYYVYGDQVTAPTVGGSFIQNGKLVTVEWFDFDDENRETIVKFPVAGPELNSLNYGCRRAELDVDFAAQGILHQVSINADFVLTLLVPKSETLTEGDIVSIDGVEYVKFSVSLKANETAKLLEFVFDVQDAEGNTYKQYETLSIASYVKALLEDDTASEADKKLAYAALDYSNEVYKFFGGAANTELATILFDHSELATAAPELEYTMNTENLNGLLRSAALRLNASPEFILKLAIGTKGTITLTYESAGEATAVSKEFDATNGEAYVIFDNFNVYDIHKDITVTISMDGTEYTGTCNLAGYAYGLAGYGHDNTFAKALLTYATLAEAHKLAEAAE